MKTRKLMAALLSTVMVVSALTACGGSGNKTSTTKSAASATSTTSTAKSSTAKSSAATSTTSGSKHIDVIAKGFQHQFWKAVELGTQNAAKEFGVEVTFQGPDNESAIAQQVEYLNTAIAKKPAAICLAALDTQASIPSIQSAMEAGIPIIGFDSGVPDAPKGAIKANASTNNAVAGALAADELYKLIESKIKDAKEPVRIGFVEKMTELCGADNVSVEGHDSLKNEKAGAKVVLDVGIPAEVKDVDAAAVASAILEKKDLIAIYGSNEFAANAIITANEGLDKLGADKVIAVGFDAGKKLLDAVRAKTFAGAVTQDPVQIGYQAVKLAVEAADGKSVSDVDTGAKWYNAENMDADDIKPCLYE